MTTQAQLFYLTNVAPDQTLSGAGTIKKIADVNPALNTAYGTITWTTTTSTEKTWIPNTANSASGDTSNNNGFVFNNGGADGLGSVSGARRFIRAGVWRFEQSPTLNSPALLATIACTMTAKVYRVATGGGARTLLFTATSANFSATADIVWNSTSQPEIILEPGEVIMVGWTATSASTTALVLGANTNTVLTFFLNTSANVTVPAPKIGTLADTVASSTGASSVPGVMGSFGGMVGSVSGSGTPNGKIGAIGSGIASSSGISTVNGVGASQAAGVANSSSTSVVTAVGASQAATVASSSSISTVTGKIGATFSGVANSSGNSTVNGVASAIGGMVANSNGASSAAALASSVSGGIGSSVGVASATGKLSSVLGTVGTANVGTGVSSSYPDGLIRLRSDGRKESVIGNTGALPAGSTRLIESLP